MYWTQYITASHVNLPMRSTENVIVQVMIDNSTYLSPNTTGVFKLCPVWIFLTQAAQVLASGTELVFVLQGMLSL